MSRSNNNLGASAPTLSSYQSDVPPPPFYDDLYNSRNQNQNFIVQNNPQTPCLIQDIQDNNHQQQILNILMKYEIKRDFATRLQQHLFMTKIVFIYDDSSSMNTKLADSPLNTNIFRASRWDELKYFSRISFEISSQFCPEDIDVFFLNRPPCRALRHINDLEPYLVNEPQGYTPIKRVMQTVLFENNPQRKLLIILVTDGEPTDDFGNSDIIGFRNCLNSRDLNVFTTIVACTDDNQSMTYLNNWDKTTPRLDVVDDFRNERLEVLRARGMNFPFSYGDYIVKCLIGSMDPQLDNLDEISNRYKNWNENQLNYYGATQNAYDRPRASISCDIL